jgi:hypothetical protein
MKSWYHSAVIFQARFAIQGNDKTTIMIDMLNYVTEYEELLAECYVPEPDFPTASCICKPREQIPGNRRG